MRRRPRERDKGEVTAPSMRDNQTWNDCPECGKEWRTIPSIPGVIHRTRLCDGCLRKTNSSPVH